MLKNKNKTAANHDRRASNKICEFLTRSYEYKNLNTEKEKQIFDAGFRFGIDYCKKTTRWS